ncbi:hypothetical protein [Alloalcanivorax xenomutans]|uniref:hypothetical protein n=1 Tax=Alloalcanivorax xenomutans TaxID=1094342 RepID=UPI00292EAC95|nr:hypothetical protein [Alloalcanivorax xenomutans]WOA32272.1 hypothetical protein RVY87_04155 [Alloalcanivorax xenomutans]
MGVLIQGFYTAQEAAHLIEVGNLARIKGWLEGYRGSSKGPLLHRDFTQREKGSVLELSFFDLIEVRFVEFFRSKGVHASTLRSALETAREAFGEKPFATNLVRFCVSKDKKIYVQETDSPIATKQEDPHLWNLASRQHEIGVFMQSMIEGSLSFDKKSRLVKKWKPRNKEFPEVFIDPLIAFGRPVVKSGITTSALYSMWKSENGDYDAVRDWFDISLSEAQQGINFEALIQSNK